MADWNGVPATGGGGEQEDDHGGGSGRWVHISDASVVPASEERAIFSLYESRAVIIRNDTFHVNTTTPSRQLVPRRGPRPYGKEIISVEMVVCKWGNGCCICWESQRLNGIRCI